MEEEQIKNSDKTVKEQRIVGKPFPKGVSGNPAGRPPGTLSLLAILKDKLAQMPEGDKRTYAEMFIENTLQDALDLDGPSRKMIMQYIEGLPMQKTELTHIIPKPLDDVYEKVDTKVDDEDEIKATENKGTIDSLLNE